MAVWILETLDPLEVFVQQCALKCKKCKHMRNYQNESNVFQRGLLRPNLLIHLIHLFVPMFFRGQGMPVVKNLP